MSAMIRLNQAKKIIRRLAAELQYQATQNSRLSLRGDVLSPRVIDLLREARDFAPLTKTELKAKRKAEFKAALKASR